MKILSCFYIFEWCKSKYLNSIYSNIVDNRQKKENTRLAFDRDKPMNLLMEFGLWTYDFWLGITQGNQTTH